MIGYQMVLLQHQHQVSAVLVLMTKMMNLYCNTVVNINIHRLSLYRHYYHTLDFHTPYLHNIK